MSFRKRMIYLSGPMTEYPESNYPLFHRIAAKLRAQGHAVYNPAEYRYAGSEFPIRQAFAEYARFICVDACTIVMLAGWEKSRGATAEHALALCCGLDILIYDG